MSRRSLTDRLHERRAEDLADSTGRPRGTWTLRSNNAPQTWKQIGQVAGVALGEIAYALHRIAGALEQNPTQSGSSGCSHANDS